MRRVMFVLLTVVVFSVSVVGDDSRDLGTRFAVAIERGDLDAIKTLIEDEGAAVDTPIDYGDHSITPLIKASWQGDLPIVEYLLAKNAAVDAVDTDSQQTALMNAVTRGHASIVKALLEAKADVSLRNKFDFTPLTTAAGAGNQEIVGLLIDAGAKVNDETSGLSALAFPVSIGDTEMMRFLVERGADVNQASAIGQTALISAIYAAQIAAVKTLIELGANVNAKMKDGTTPLKLAQKGDQEEIIALLEAAGAKP